MESFSNAIIPTVNMPINTPYTCHNQCGTHATCSRTGQQCMTDADCPGCTPPTPPSSRVGAGVPGDYDGGKLTDGVTPVYSSLTHGYGTRNMGTVPTHTSSSTPPSRMDRNLMWTASYNQQMDMFRKRYVIPDTGVDVPYLLHYPPQHNVTGQAAFAQSTGPLAANTVLS
jgi:hypothetical protein